jgi:hypothetical protein
MLPNPSRESARSVMRVIHHRSVLGSLDDAFLNHVEINLSMVLWGLRNWSCASLDLALGISS